MASVGSIAFWFLFVGSMFLASVRGDNKNETSCTSVIAEHPELQSNYNELCALCVQTIWNQTTKETCIFDITSPVGTTCSEQGAAGQFDRFEASNVTQCAGAATPNTTTTTTSTTPTTTSTTPTTTSTTPTTTSTPPTNTTTSSTTTSTPPTTTTTAGTKTTTVPTTAAPSSNGGGGIGYFFGGMAFTLGLGSVVYVVWRFYKARAERNYHTFPATSRFASFC